jgi:uncharacterized protein
MSIEDKGKIVEFRKLFFGKLYSKRVQQYQFIDENRLSNIFTTVFDCYGNTVLHRAIMKRVRRNKQGECNHKLIEYLLSNVPLIGEITNSKGMTPLNYALECGDARTVRILLDADVNIDTTLLPLHKLSMMRNTSIEYSAVTNEIYVFDKLLKRGADVNAQNGHNSTCLHCASLYGKEHIVKLLLENGAEPNIRNNNGNTPLSIAVEEYQYGICRLLLYYGADLTVPTGHNSLLEIAIFNNNKKVFKALLKYNYNYSVNYWCEVYRHALECAIDNSNIRTNVNRTLLSIAHANAFYNSHSRTNERYHITKIVIKYCKKHNIDVTYNDILCNIIKRQGVCSTISKCDTYKKCIRKMLNKCDYIRDDIIKNALSKITYFKGQEFFIGITKTARQNDLSVSVLKMVLNKLMY